ncbi:FAD-dependent oxidoreductase [Cystobacter fuscus]
MTSSVYNVVVVGGGFFGCCIALHLRRFHPRVLLVEREAHLLGRASLVNQARVHNGYHYPRSVLTALRSRVNFDRFVEQYADCVVNDFTKLYAVPRRFSNVTAAQFRGFCERIGAPLRPAPERLRALFDDEHIEAVFEVREYAFDAVKLRERVASALEAQGVEVRLGTEACRLMPAGDEGLEVELSQGPGRLELVRGTHVFNSTYARLNTVLRASGLPILPLKYEVAEMALIEPPEELRRWASP